MTDVSEIDERFAKIDREVAAVVRNPAVYRRAAELIRTKGHTREVFAATGLSEEGGQVCNIEDPAAACFCIMGALVRAGVDLDLIHPSAPFGGWSDTTRHGLLMIPTATSVMGLPYSANRWNNKKDRLAADVIEALEAGAENLEQGAR